MQFASKIAETESWKFSANSASLHLCVKNLWDGNVVVCHNDQTAAKLPRSVKVAGFDGLAADGTRRFPSICQPIRQIAETAIASLLERIRRPTVPPRQILLEPYGDSDIAETLRGHR